MDKILLKNMSFYGYHGVLEEEKRLGQRFYVDVTLFLNLQKAGASDDLQDTVNYARVYALTEEIVTGKKFYLLEAVAKTICTRIQEQFPEVKGVRVAVRKPSVPIAGVLDYTEVTLETGDVI